MELRLELVLLFISVLFFLSILAGKAGYRFGVPVLLLFLVVGMVAGSDGFGIQFENIAIAQSIGTVSLCLILFNGGMGTKIEKIKPVIAQGIVLATVGVLLTAAFTGVLVWWVLGKTNSSAGVGLLASLLLASIMSSTDSASVFSILRNRGMALKNNLRPLLELESGSNDPMAYVLVITLIELIKMGSAPNYLTAIGTLVSQLVIGLIVGYVLGKLAIFGINRLKIDNPSFYPILLLAFSIFIFSSAHFLRGNGYLAVYIGGLVIGNSTFVHKRYSMSFFKGMAWICQLLLFLTLGLLVNPHELVPVFVPALIISFLMIFVTRPLSVFLCLLPFRKMKTRDKTFVSWVGLRGAVPIVFAIFVLAEEVPNARLMFNIVFFCTLISLLIQGTSVSFMANLLSLSEKRLRMRRPVSFDLEYSDEINASFTEIVIGRDSLENGNFLKDLKLPPDTLAVMVKRDVRYFVPTGKTELEVGDKLLIVTDNAEDFMKSHGMESD